jgi:predicted O-methyltransferase YrrM
VPSNLAGPIGISPEQAMVTEGLPENLLPADGYFGSFFALMRRSLVAGGSEMGLGMSLFSLAVSIQATQILEIGRFKGFSTLCLASALKFLDIGWKEPQQHKQRPDVDYAAREHRTVRKLYSVDPFPTPEALHLIAEADVAGYVELLNCRSDVVTPKAGSLDLAFIDGDHTYEGCKADVLRFLPAIRTGGYFVLHDYYGWYDAQGRNNSPIKRVADELAATGQFQHLLIDTGYPSLVVFRK